MRELASSLKFALPPAVNCIVSADTSDIKVLPPPSK